MTESEIAAYNLGVRAVLDAARRSAEDLSRAAATWKPTRVAFAIAALDEFADAGAALLIGGGDDLNFEAVDNAPGAPLNPRHGGAPTELVVRAHAGDDGNFGLTDEEIIRPSRQTIVNWLSGRTPMLASHWSRIAANMLKSDGEHQLGERSAPIISAAE